MECNLKTLVLFYEILPFCPDKITKKYYGLMIMVCHPCEKIIILGVRCFSRALEHARTLVPHTFY